MIGDDYPESFRFIASSLRHADTVLDIGPGIRPQPFLTPALHLCVEPHDEYVRVLRERGFLVIHDTAQSALRFSGSVDTIFLLDVIEHLERADGERVLALAAERAREVVLYTPTGFKPQSYASGEKDAWGMNGTAWQTHRSGWTPPDFPGWRIVEDAPRGAFFAVLTRP